MFGFLQFLNHFFTLRYIIHANYNTIHRSIFKNYGVANTSTVCALSNENFICSVCNENKSTLHHTIFTGRSTIICTFIAKFTFFVGFKRKTFEHNEIFSH